MKKNTHIIKIQAFTLIEVLVALTILAIVMVSVMGIFSVASQVALKTDINREMQQNIKSIVETIAEDVRKNGIIGTSIGYTDPYDFGPSGQKNGIRLKTGIAEYKLYGYNPTLGESLDDSIVRDSSFCQDIKHVCLIYKEGVGPLSNSKISLTDLSFNVSGGAIPKVSINFTARAAIKNGLRPDLIKNSSLDFQTTISERSLQIK